jgi:hypothetical protein
MMMTTQSLVPRARLERPGAAALRRRSAARAAPALRHPRRDGHAEFDSYLAWRSARNRAHVPLDARGGLRRRRPARARITAGHLLAERSRSPSWNATAASRATPRASKEELSAARSSGVLIVPMGDIADLFSFDQLAAREFWTPVEHRARASPRYAVDRRSPRHRLLPAASPARRARRGVAPTRGRARAAARRLAERAGSGRACSTCRGVPVSRSRATSLITAPP